MTNVAKIAFSDYDATVARRAYDHEPTINEMQVDFRKRHVRRLGKGKCSPSAGLMFVDCVDNLEKIADHLCNVAEGVMAGLQWQDLSGEEPPAEADTAPGPA